MTSAVSNYNILLLFSIRGSFTFCAVTCNVAQSYSPSVLSSAMVTAGLPRVFLSGIVRFLSCDSSKIVWLLTTIWSFPVVQLVLI